MEEGDLLTLSSGASFDTAAVFAASMVMVPTRDGDEDRPTVLVAGRHTAASLRQAAALRGAQVLFVPPAGQDAAHLAPVLAKLRAQSHGVVILSADDSATFADRLRDARRTPLRRVDSYLHKAATAGWAAEVWPAVLARVLAGLNLDELRTASAPVVRPLPSMQVMLRTATDWARQDTATIPNVIGRIEGTDTLLRNHPLVVTAHLVHTDRSAAVAGGGVGRGAVQTDQDASEVVGLLALAEAVSRSELRPRRPVIFLATSGGGKGEADWGIDYYIYTHTDEARYSMGVGFGLAPEPLGQPGGDTLLVGGLEDVVLPRPLDWMLAAHPELRLTLKEGADTACPAAECLTGRSTFAQLWIPSLVFNSSTFAAGDRRGDAATDAGTVEREARTLQLVYHLITDLAARPEPRDGARAPASGGNSFEVRSPDGSQSSTKFRDGEPLAEQVRPLPLPPQPLL